MDFTEAELAELQFALIRNVCYPDSRHPRSVVPTGKVNVLQRRNSTIAETSGGYRLASVNPRHFNEDADVDNIVSILVHEVSHTNDGGGYGKGISSHGPQFWTEVATNINRCRDSEVTKTLIQSGFEDTIDWRRVIRYSLDSIGHQHDRRSGDEEWYERRFVETLDEYTLEEYNAFENRNFGIASGSPDDSMWTSPAQVTLPNNRMATQFTDDEIREYLDECTDDSGKTKINAPLVWAYPEKFKTRGVTRIQENDRWEFVFNSERERLKLAAMDRISGFQWATSAEHVMENPELDWHENVGKDIDIESVPTEKPYPRKVAFEMEYDSIQDPVSVTN